MLDRVEARIKEITAEVKQAESKIQTLTQEYHQLIGYRQALLDAKNAQTEQVDVPTAPETLTEEGA